MEEIKIPEIERQALFSFAESLKKKLGEKVKKIALFGSGARGRFGEGSDIDVFVVLQEKTRAVEDEIHDLLMVTLLKYGVYLSVVVFPFDEYIRLNNIPTIFMQNVAREGIPI